MELNVVVLAAGQGTRMKSSLPKVLHPIGAKPMLAHVIQTAFSLNPKQLTIVVGHESGRIRATCADPRITWVEQPQQKGTGDAVGKALPQIKPDQRVLILYGDVPLITAQTLHQLLQQTPPDAIGMITVDMASPHGLGRIIRNSNGDIQRIVEERDASESERKIHEVNTGIFVFPATFLSAAIPQLQNNNKQGEYYLTDLIEMAVRDRMPINSIRPNQYYEIQGVNDRSQQAMLEKVYQSHQALLLMNQGVQIIDPMRFDLRGTISTQEDVSIDINVVLQGHNVLEKGCRIDANCILIDCEIGEGAHILANSYLEKAKIGRGAVVGPFARVRPGTVLGANAKIGNFVEVKNTQIGAQSKINHLSYIGDAIIGNEVNIGAGTITCNYDGVNKHQTIIEDGAHIGSDTQLVAPVRVGQNATIGAGTTLCKDAPPHQLTLSNQLKHRSVDWQQPKKKE
jgi:bifunctional UDP-N-acetylglucosamine pyrophosphorylase/glucosamine-1-phosphate N-acetyltransferase